MNAIDKVEVEISVVLGKATMPIHQLLKMGRGAVIELDAHETEEVWLLANNQPIARGEIVVQGEHVGVSITEVLQQHTF
jgi:flagellar motor switch protein FliN/FliY